MVQRVEPAQYLGPLCGESCWVLQIFVENRRDHSVDLPEPHWTTLAFSCCFYGGKAGKNTYGGMAIPGWHLRAIGVSAVFI